MLPVTVWPVWFSWKYIDVDEMMLKIYFNGCVINLSRVHIARDSGRIATQQPSSIDGETYVHIACRSPETIITNSA